MTKPSTRGGSPPSRADQVIAAFDSFDPDQISPETRFELGGLILHVIDNMPTSSQEAQRGFLAGLLFGPATKEAMRRGLAETDPQIDDEDVNLFMSTIVNMVAKGIF